MIRMLNSTVPSWVLPAVLFAIIIVAFVAMMVFQSKRRKKQEKEAKDLIDSVKPGNKVKTIGGVCGIVVEVDAEENTFVLETGSVTAGKSYVKFDRQAIWQTDAAVSKPEESENGDGTFAGESANGGETPAEKAENGGGAAAAEPAEAPAENPSETKND